MNLLRSQRNGLAISLNDLSSVSVGERRLGSVSVGQILGQERCKMKGEQEANMEVSSKRNKYET